jgi:hypothetical protein
MKQLTTYVLTFIKKRYKFRDKNKMWMEVPTICNSRKEKEEIILNTIEHLEQHIYIKIK